MNFTFEQGPALRAIMPVALRAQCAEECGVPLRGGFYNPLPGTPRPVPLAARSTGGEWEQFPESFAATVLSLSRDKCAPPLICWMPKGVHCIRPEGNPDNLPIVWKVDKATASVANRHLQALRAKAASGGGQIPFIDFNHEGGVAGHIHEFFWDDWGIRAAVSWTPEGEAAILAGSAISFSPHWISSGGSFLGLRACVGGLLTSGVEPAFRRMPPIQPIQKRQALQLCANRFMRKVDYRASELAAQGVELAALQAFKEIKAEQPELHACHALREAINDEHWKDTKLKYA